MTHPDLASDSDHLLGPVSAAGAQAGLAYALYRLMELGATVPEGSRVKEAYRLLDSSQSKPRAVTRSPSFRRKYAEASVLAFEFHQIARCFGPVGRRRSPLSKLIKRDLQRSYNGVLDPLARDEVTRRGRDFQFQLWLLAWLVAGDKPNKYQEPDLRTAYRFEWRGIAAKRAQSPASIVDLTKAGAAQVKKHNSTGFVAIAIDNYSPGFRERLKGLRDPRKAFDRLPEIQRAVIWCRERAPWIRGLVIFGSVAQWSMRSTPTGFTIHRLVFFQALPEDDTDKGYLDSFFNELEASYTRRTRAM